MIRVVAVQITDDGHVAAGAAYLETARAVGHLHRDAVGDPVHTRRKIHFAGKHGLGLTERLYDGSAVVGHTVPHRTAVANVYATAGEALYRIGGFLRHLLTQLCVGRAGLRRLHRRLLGGSRLRRLSGCRGGVRPGGGGVCAGGIQRRLGGGGVVGGLGGADGGALRLIVGRFRRGDADRLLVEHAFQRTLRTVGTIGGGVRRRACPCLDLCHLADRRGGGRGRLYGRIHLKHHHRRFFHLLGGAVHRPQGGPQLTGEHRMLTQYRPLQTDAVLLYPFHQRRHVGKVIVQHLLILHGIGLSGGDLVGGYPRLLLHLGAVDAGLHHLAMVTGGDTLRVKGHIQMKTPPFIRLPSVAAEQKLPCLA